MSLLIGGCAQYFRFASQLLRGSPRLLSCFSKIFVRPTGEFHMSTGLLCRAPGTLSSDTSVFGRDPHVLGMAPQFLRGSALLLCDLALLLGVATAALALIRLIPIQIRRRWLVRHEITPLMLGIPE